MNPDFDVLIPSRDLLGFSPYARGCARHAARICFNPFQGFIRVFTIDADYFDVLVFKCFNPFQGFIRVFTHLYRRERAGTGSCFNPFQGFIRVFTCSFLKIKQSQEDVLIPSRDLLGFSPPSKSLKPGSSSCFNPFQGFIRVFTCFQILSHQQRSLKF